jgi:GAF domain-containing protein
VPGNNEYFQALCNISRVLGTTLKKDEILALIVRTAQGLIKGKAISIFLIDEKTNELVPIAQEGLSPEYLRQFSRPSKLVAILKKEGYLYIRDATTDPRLDDHEIIKAEGIASILVVPIMIKGQLIGGLSLYADTLRDFSEEEIGFLAAIAAQGGSAIEHTRLVERLRENVRLFNDLSANINASLDLPKIFHILSADLAKTIKVKASSVLLVDEEQGSLERVASYGLSEKYLHRGPLSLERSVLETLESKPVVIKNVATDDRVQFGGQKLEEGIVSILSVPIKTRDKVIGVLRLYSGAPRDFTEDEIMLVTALAYHGGLAIHNARLNEQVKQNTRLFHDLSTNINSSLDLPKIFHILAADIAETLKVKASSVLLVNEAQGSLERVASYGLSEKYLHRGPLSLEKSVSETMEGKPVVIKNAATDNRVQHRKQKIEEGIVSILSAPIKTKEKVIGVLRLYSGIPREFTKGEIMLVTALANQGGLAIQNASMYQLLRDDMKDLQEDIWSHRLWF